MKPLTEDSFSWARTTSEVQQWPELAEIWADWLLGDKPVRQRDARDLTDTATKMEKAREWTAQVSLQEKEGEAFQVEKRAQALQLLPSDLVASRREKLLSPQLSEPTTPTPGRPRF